MSSMSGEVTPRPAGPRPAQAGELCTCGRQAVTVYLGGRFGDTGGCGLHDSGDPRDGVCTFCGDTVDHRHYALTEHAAGRDAPGLDHDGEAQGGRCPLYRLRLADPLPELHPGSVRPFDPAADRLARAPHRLQVELDAIVTDARRAAGHPRPDELDDDVAATTEIGVQQVMQALDERGARAAVELTLDVLVDACEQAGAPEATVDWLLDLRARDRDQLIDQVGHVEWEQTDPVDRPLLIARRVVRRALNPEVPKSIHRQWWA